MKASLREVYALAFMLLGLILVLAVIADHRLDRLECQEDQACWNCEEMGNRICGDK